MKINITFLTVSVLMILIFSCKEQRMLDDPELKRLKTWMSGSFNSEAQAEADTNFYNIHLHMVPIWTDRTDAFWLYVEQAASWTPDKPYRQRVYRLTKMPNGVLESAVFTMADPLRFAGAWKESNPLNQLTPDSLEVREGCAIILQKEGHAFTGSTVGKNCGSDLRGASYATSEVRIEENTLTSWDRGYDANDQQVWGAETGPYIFRKIVK